MNKITVRERGRIEKHSLAPAPPVVGRTMVTATLSTGQQRSWLIKDVIGWTWNNKVHQPQR